MVRRSSPACGKNQKWEPLPPGDHNRSVTDLLSQVAQVTESDPDGFPGDSQVDGVEERRIDAPPPQFA